MKNIYAENKLHSVLDAGIFSRPRGKTAGLVFGAARTRRGKLVTARQLVPPSNPNTPAQQTQRSKFAQAQDIIRRFGVGIYQNDWNRSVGQLPGFQSMLSTYINQMDDSFNLTLVNNINLGTLPPVTSLEVDTPVAGTIGFNWVGNQTSPATGEDQVVILLAATTASNRSLAQGIIVDTSAPRSDGGVSLTGLPSSVEYQIYVYCRGAGTAEGLLSVTQILSATTT